MLICLCKCIDIDVCSLGNYMHINIIVHDAWFNLSIWHALHMEHGINMQWHIALHMHGSITSHGCECRVENQHYTW